MKTTKIGNFGGINKRTIFITKRKENIMYNDKCLKCGSDDVKRSAPLDLHNCVYVFLVCNKCKATTTVVYGSPMAVDYHDEGE